MNSSLENKCLKLPEPRWDPMDQTDPVNPGLILPEYLVIIDDNPYLCEIYTEILSGYRTRCFHTAEQALSWWSDHGGDSVGLVLCDYDLGSTTGVDLMTRLKEMDPEVRSVLMTGSALPDQQRKQTRDLFHACYFKPVSLNGLLEIVRNHFAFNSSPMACVEGS